MARTQTEWEARELELVNQVDSLTSELSVANQRIAELEAGGGTEADKRAAKAEADRDAMRAAVGAEKLALEQKVAALEAELATLKG